MNPIDQLMQSVGSSLNPAVAGLMGISQTPGTGPSNTAAQFAQALQNIEPTSATPGVQALKALDLSPEQAELLATMQIALPADAAAAPAQLAPFAASIQKVIDPSAALAAAPMDGTGTAQAGQAAGATAPMAAMQAKNSVSGLAIQAATSADQGAGNLLPQNVAAPAQGGQGVPMLPQAALEQLGLKLEQLPALPSAEELAAVSQAGVSTKSHILPATQAQGLFNVAAEKAPVLTLAPEGTTVQLTPAPTGQNALNPSLTPEEGMTASLAKPVLGAPVAPTAPAAAPASAGTPGQAPQIATNVSAQPEQAAQAAQGAQAPQTPIAGDAPAEAAEAEGNAVVTQQAQQQVAAAAPKPALDRNPQPAAKAGSLTKGTSPVKEPMALKVGAEAAPEIHKEAASAKPVEPVMKLPETQAPVPTREALPPLTPERVSGFLDGTSASAVAAGLSGLKGETGFMASMSLLGGKPSPELAKNVGQQLNMHVTKAVNEGQQAFTVRLDPAELGRVRVKLNFLENGRVHAQVMAERPETLDLMQRDTRGLEKALEATGHKANGGIQFSLDTNDQESAGRAFAEAVQQEKMRDDLAARSGLGNGGAHTVEDELVEEEIPLETILANVSVETGLDIEV